MLGKGRDDAQRKQFFDEWLARDPRAAVDALRRALRVGTALRAIA